MYALKVEQGKERILVRHISSGFVPSFQAKPGVRLLVVPGYVFSLVKVARSELVARGIAVYNPAIDKTVQDVVHRADENMYKNKKK